MVRSDRLVAFRSVRQSGSSAGCRRSTTRHGSSQAPRTRAVPSCASALLDLPRHIEPCLPGSGAGRTRTRDRGTIGETIRRRYCNDGWWPTTPEVGLFNPDTMRTTRYRYRGAAIPTPWVAKG